MERTFIYSSEELNNLKLKIYVHTDLCKNGHIDGNIQLKEFVKGSYMGLDDLLVFHCAPTLAGLKGAALICVASEGTDYKLMIEAYNKRYNHRGLYFRTISSCKGRKLLYIYRPAMMVSYLCRPECQEFLKGYGYEAKDLEGMLTTLEERFQNMGEFPHELGIFLEYPLEDVRAFIQHRGHNAKLCGEWKVYTDVSYAEREFSKYRVCRKCYVDMFNRGFTIERLIIA